ncbi:MAG: prolyl oligopeptidase family serine peptidase [Planctomycetaceae bacterium]|jgi:predicted peptidase|nr:prolyl oligopeptidase family serine peptidase [Planctomycetaceae bacterium]
MRDNNLSKPFKNDQLIQQNFPSPFFNRAWGHIVVFLLIVNAFYFFCYDPNFPYALSHSLWYVDFRYWSDWILGCCWLVPLWAWGSTIVALFIPKNTERLFLLRRSFYHKIIGLLFLYLLWTIWYNYATLPLVTIFEPIISPVTNYIYKNYTLPLADYYTTGEGSNPMLLPTIAGITLIVVIVTWRILYHYKRWKRSKISKTSETTDTTNKTGTTKTTMMFLLLLVCIPTMLGADATITPKEPVPPKKVETSIGIYDVKSQDDILNFTTGQIRELVKMEDNRTKGAGKTPHPVLVYCFEERSFQYTGGKYENSEIKYRLHVPRKIKPNTKYPLVVHLHGVGEAGKDNTFSLAHLHSVLPLMVGEKQQDFYLLVLQCPSDNRVWTFKPEKDGNLDVVVALTDHVIANNPIDEKRLSLFGLSSGGYGVWRWLLKYPDKFAAAVPTSCGSPIDYLHIIATLKETSIWTFRNKNDNNAPIESIREAMRVINGSNGFMKLTQFDQGGHAAWRPAMDEYNCFGWMIAQKRGGWFNPPPERKIYTYRSMRNCFFAFFLPLLLATGMLIFQRTKYCERLHEGIAKEFYSGRSAKEDEQDDDDGDVTKDFYTWTDNTRNQELELKLIDVKNGDARFETLDGKVIVINIARFCIDDQRVLKSYNEQVPDKKFRIWTDISGTQKFEAKLIGVQNNLVLFQSKTGDTGTMNIKSLSEADQKLIRQLKEQKSL